MGAAELSAADARWLAIEAQGLARPRTTGTVRRRDLLRAIGAVGTVQLDAVNVLERTQFLVLFSRLGAYDVGVLHELVGPGGALFEHWGHAASLLPVETHPLFRWRMAQHGTAAEGRARADRRQSWLQANADYLAAVLAEVRDRGPLAGSELSDPRRRDGEWWDRRSVGRQALEWLLATGQLAAWRRPNFERLYDLPERVLPPAVLQLPTPTVEDAQRALVLSAMGSLGVATASDLADYYRVRLPETRARIAELVEGGDLVEVSVEGWTPPAYCLPAARPRPPQRTNGTLLSPFDSLIWERERTRRLFGFDFRIEIYFPEPQRRFGYYVLPLLVGDQLVGRFDLKADRRVGVLRVVSSHVEPGADPSLATAAAAGELRSMAEWLALGGVAAAPVGSLAQPLARALA